MSAKRTNGRSYTTLGENESKVAGASRRSHRSASPQSLLTAESLRRFIASGMCPYCPRGPFKCLSLHTGSVHGIDQKELRDRADLTSRDPISSEGLREECRKRAIERDIGATGGDVLRRARQEGKVPKHGRAGAAKVAAALAAARARQTPEERSRRAAHAQAAVTPEGRRRIGEANRNRARELKPCGTVAAYRRGCRCEACASAQREKNLLRKQS